MDGNTGNGVAGFPIQEPDVQPWAFLDHKVDPRDRSFHPNAPTGWRHDWGRVVLRLNHEILLVQSENLIAPVGAGHRFTLAAGSGSSHKEPGANEHPQSWIAGREGHSPFDNPVMAELPPIVLRPLGGPLFAFGPRLIGLRLLAFAADRNQDR